MFTTRRSVAIFIFKCIMVHPKADISHFIHDYGISKDARRARKSRKFLFLYRLQALVFYITDIIQRSKKGGGYRFYQNALQSTIV